jgi:hypothetical protein
MPGKYAKNFTKQGYAMHYRKGIDGIPFKNCVYQFKIELTEISPLIWRRILVPSDYNFWDLHVAIQDSLGWLDYHLHHFSMKKKGKKAKDDIGIPDFDGFDDMPEIFPGWEIPILSYFHDLGATATYTYDYGDSWRHSLQLEGYLFKEKNIKYPICIAGERACPPEDCGGTNGYTELLKTLSDPEDEDNEAMKTWVGKDWGPEKFDKNSISFDNPYQRWKKAFLKNK